MPELLFLRFQILTEKMFFRDLDSVVGAADDSVIYPSGRGVGKVLVELYSKSVGRGRI